MVAEAVDVAFSPRPVVPSAATAMETVSSAATAAATAKRPPRLLPPAVGGDRHRGLPHDLGAGRVPCVRLLRQRAGEDLSDRSDLERRRLLEVGEEERDLRVRTKRRPAGERLVENARERVLIRASVDRVAADLFRRDVRRCAEREPRPRVIRRTECSTEAEVGQIRVVGVVEEDVRRLDVAMDEAARVRRIESRSDLGADRERAAGCERRLVID